MVLASTVVAVLLGTPLGILLHVTAPNGLNPRPVTHQVVGAVVDVVRSLPFVVLLIALTEVTHAIVGTSIGSTASIVPLAIGAVPFFGRLVQNVLREVNASVVEAAITTGATRAKIVRSVLLRESAPGLVAAVGVTAVALLGYSAVAGLLGGGGLGDLAIRKGYQGYDNTALYMSVAVLGVIALILQFVFDFAARAIDKRRSAAI
ncbi:ABC transporter permease [Pseudonocardiaceae bacterium YIM PH 21723]|nr:ABC transporter permease [Pseudonocardiaceae bacterium YIM PH 21723]